jgi:hypothetical protein
MKRYLFLICFIFVYGCESYAIDKQQREASRNLQFKSMRLEHPTYFKDNHNNCFAHFSGSNPHADLLSTVPCEKVGL